jgi:hypothetical protein
VAEDLLAQVLQCALPDQVFLNRVSPERKVAGL